MRKNHADFAISVLDMTISVMKHAIFCQNRAAGHGEAIAERGEPGLEALRGRGDCFFTRTASPAERGRAQRSAPVGKGFSRSLLPENRADVDDVLDVCQFAQGFFGNGAVHVDERVGKVAAVLVKHSGDVQFCVA